MKEYTIEITTYCQHKCDYCSTNATPNGSHIELNTVRQFLSGVSHVDRINISGGEPLAHPQFWDILQYCRSLTSDVWVYTNALDKIRYNSGIVAEITVEANVCIAPGRLVYIPKNAARVHLLQLVPQGRANNITPASISLSGNACDDDRCSECNHLVLQADGQVATGPCKKKYEK